MKDWAKLTVAQLREELRSRNMPYLGRKQELLNRLNRYPQMIAEREAEEREAREREAQNDAHDDAPVDDEEPARVDTTATPEAADTPATMDIVKDDLPTEAKSEERDKSVTPPETEAPAAEPIADAQKEPEEDKEIPAEDRILRDAPPTSITTQDDSLYPPDEHMLPLDSSPPTEALSVPPETFTRDASIETQKRKRRSMSPVPREESVARKRARADDATNGSEDPVVSTVAVVEMDVEQEQSSREPEEEPEVTKPEPEVEARQESPPARDDDPMEFERDVAPAVHPATCALYIKNLMRPLHSDTMRAHLTDLATPSSESSDDTIIASLWIDQVRTHAFVVFKTTSAAARVRTALHDSVWPNESNRKALWVDFVPPEKVQDWIETEESSGGRRSGARWEVFYETGPGGSVEAHLESGSRSGPTPSRPPPGPSADAIPTGPRSLIPPTGPRPVRPGSGPGPRPPPTRTGSSYTTRARPSIEYTKVPEDLAARRIENMHSFYTRDTARALGRDINRYSFENGDSFVDRGKEIFEGIRPPHRSRGGGGGGGFRRGGRGGGFGGRDRDGGFRPRSDRYLPGLSNDRRDGGRRRD